MVNINDYASVIQDKAASDVSSRYCFIPTTRALEVMQDYGWKVANITERNSRKAEYKGYQKHLVTLRNEELIQTYRGKQYFPTVNLINAHDRSSQYEIDLGIFNQVCANGLIAGVAWGKVTIRHTGFKTEMVEAACKQIAEAAPKLISNVETFEAIELTQLEAEKFAKDAIELRFDGDKYAVKPDELLRAHRYYNNPLNLWTVYNKVQENVIRGGIRTQNKTGHYRQSKAVKAIDSNVKMNKQLWDMAEAIAAAKGAYLPVLRIN